MGVIDSNLLEIRSASFDKNQFALHALRPISKHQTLITLPSNAYFSGSSFASTPGGIAAKKLLQEVGLWNPSDENRQMLLISLAASAANDDNPSSILAPYVRNVLPKNFTTPTTWSEDAMEAILGSEVHVNATALKKAQQKMYHALCPELEQVLAGVCSHLLWAMEIVSTRAHEVAADAIVAPLLDIPNHNFSIVETTVLNKGDDGTLVWRASQDVSEGEEVFLAYGQRMGNAALLLRYGFSIDDNPFSSTVMQSSTSSVLKEQGHAMHPADEKLLQEIQDRFLLYPGQFPNGYVSSVRFLFCGLLQHACTRTAQERMPSLVQELQMLNAVVSSLETKRTSLPGGSASDDEVEFQIMGSDWPADMQLAFRYRMEQKSILQSNQELVEAQARKVEALMPIGRQEL